MSLVRLKFRLDRNDSGVWGTDPTDDCGFEVLRSTEVSLNGSWRITDPAIRCLTATERLIGPLELGDMLVTKSSGSEAHVGKAALVGVAEARRNAYFSNFSQRLRPTTALEARYLFYLWNSRHGRAHMEVSSSGSMAIRNLTGDMLGLLRIPIDRLSRQRLIADFLDREADRIDALIDAKRRLIALLAEKRTALGTHAVTKGLDLSVPMKDSGIPWIGEVPEHWDIRRLAHIVSRSNAGEVIDKSFWGTGEETLYTCARNPMSSDFPGFPDWKRTRDSDLLLTRNGTPYVHLPKYGSIYSNVVQRIRLIGRMDRDFISYSLGVSCDNLHGYGVSIESLNYGMWSSLPVTVPPDREQVAIVQRLDSAQETLLSAVDAIQLQLALLAEYRQALITAAVTGQLDEETLKGAKPADEAMGMEVPS